jgi:hypothetical protein
VTALGAALTTIGGTPLGAAALAEVREVVLAPGVKGVDRAGDTATVRRQVGHGRAGRLDGAELQAALEAQL